MKMRVLLRIAAEVVGDCVEAVCKNASNKVVCATANGEVELCTKHKDKRKTWIERGLAIFMLRHPQIFKGNAEDASTTLGVARSFLPWGVSMNSKKTLVHK